jgi:four helix bundle protein
MRNFKELAIWNRSILLTKRIYKLTSELPKSEIYGLTSQMRRCAVSIPSNIAEGCSRRSNKEMRRYLEISLGSSFELETQLLLTKELYNNLGVSKELLDELIAIQKMINSFKLKI